MNNNDKKILSLHKQGTEVSTIIEQTGLSRSKVYQVIHNYKNNIIVTYAKRGRKIGEKRLLTPEQEQQLYKMLTTSKPELYNFTDTKLWTRKTVKALIGTFDIIVCDNTVKNYLKRLKLYYPECQDIKTQSHNLSNEPNIICISLRRLINEKKNYSSYLVYTYDKYGTYYFLCYSEKEYYHSWLDIFYNFINRLPFISTTTKIKCIMPNDIYSRDMRKTWKNGKYNKLINEDQISFHAQREK